MSRLFLSASIVGMFAVWTLVLLAITIATFPSAGEVVAVAVLNFADWGAVRSSGGWAFTVTAAVYTLLFGLLVRSVLSQFQKGAS